MKILFVTSEAYPFAVSGGLADVSAALPKALRKRFIGARVVLPLYDSIPQEYKDQMKFVTSFSVPVSWRRQYCGVFELRREGVVYYFIDNQYYFNRPGLYGHYDDGERFAFYARAVLEMLLNIDFKPDILHCNDWQTALTPVYFHSFYGHLPEMSSIKTVYTIHNIQYQGQYDPAIIGDVFGLSGGHEDLVMYDGCVNLMKGGIECANAVTTVSETYAEELLNPWYSHGMDNILRERCWKLIGIVNGIDTSVYDPETDPFIYTNYSAADFAGKAINKSKLQSELGLPADKSTPLIAMVTRLVSHKGLDLVCRCVERFLSGGVQLAILGSGDTEYENFFQDLSEKYPDKFAFRCGFIPELAHKIYAGADIFLMPSKSEPCGLAQMVALRYGTIPVVRETGGLKDTVQDSGGGDGNGFTFADYDSEALAHTLSRAILGYENRAGWKLLVERAMLEDNSWNNSANEYIKLYKTISK